MDIERKIKIANILTAHGLGFITFQGAQELMKEVFRLDVIQSNKIFAN